MGEWFSFCWLICNEVSLSRFCWLLPPTPRNPSAIHQNRRLHASWQKVDFQQHGWMVIERLKSKEKGSLPSPIQVTGDWHQRRDNIESILGHSGYGPRPWTQIDRLLLVQHTFATNPSKLQGIQIIIRRMFCIELHRFHFQPLLLVLKRFWSTLTKSESSFKVIQRHQETEQNRKENAIKTWEHYKGSSNSQSIRVPLLTAQHHCDTQLSLKLMYMAGAHNTFANT